MDDALTATVELLRALVPGLVVAETPDGDCVTVQHPRTGRHLHVLRVLRYCDGSRHEVRLVPEGVEQAARLLCQGVP